MSEMPIITLLRIRKAMMTNLSGVRRLAKFVCAYNNTPVAIYKACELQCGIQNLQWPTK